jgi:acetylornithine deacetylase/succinyl-diaminopimelate desuccinylase-like protein
MHLEGASAHKTPADILMNLIRFDTTNPPGNEGECVAYIRDLLELAGFKTTTLAKDSARPNLLTRLDGRGEAPPLMLYGHLDVVTTAHQEWAHPPFEAREIDGYIWGRGALDMKSGVAMMLAALLRAKAEGFQPRGDILFAALADEEDFGTYGSKFLVQEHADYFEGVRYALGEFGGFSMYIAGKKFYPIQLAEKQICMMKATVHGPGGHGSRLMRGGAMARAANFMQQLERHRLPVHITPLARMMINAIADHLGGPTGFVLRQILNPALTDRILGLLGSIGENLEPLFRNTLNATMIQGGEKINVIPSKIEIGMDGRLLPGFSPEDMIQELRAVVGDGVELEVVQHDHVEADIDMGLFDTLGSVIKEADPEGEPIPLLIPAVTDGRIFSQLGIQSYGFIPMKLPEEFNFFETIHAADERIPVEAVAFGAKAIYEVIRRHGDGNGEDKRVNNDPDWRLET